MITRKPTKWLILLLALFTLMGKAPLLLAEHLDSMVAPEHHATLSNCHSNSGDMAADNGSTMDGCDQGCPLCSLSSHLIEANPQRALPVTAHLISSNSPYSVQEHHPKVEHGPPRHTVS